MTPFLHCIQENFFAPRPLAILEEFAATAEWSFFDSRDFPQYVSSKAQVQSLFFDNSGTRVELGYYLSKEFIDLLQELSSSRLRKCVGISFHRLVKGCFNVVHNDANCSGEKVRVVAYLSYPGNYEGGELNLFDVLDLENPSVSFKPYYNSAFIFSMNERSVHSVSEILAGERISIVLTYG